MKSLYGIEFAAWHNLSFLGIMLFLLFGFVCFHVIRSRRVVAALAGGSGQKGILKHYQVWRRLLKYLLFFGGVVFLMLALLQPQWDLKDQVVEQEGRDILIGIDISRSMLAQDYKPNRLEFAKEKIKKLLYNLSCDRVGLMLFSGTTVMQCPLTSDYSTFFMFLDQLDSETISASTTALDNAVIKAVEVFQSMPTRKTKIFCLFTDGEDFSDNLGRVKEQAAQEGISIFTFGVGTEHGAPIPILNRYGMQVGLEKDDNNSVVMSKLNEPVLIDLAEKSGGKYIRAIESEKDIKQLISLVHAFETDQLDDKKINRLEEQYPYFVGVSFLCLLLEWIL